MRPDDHIRTILDEDVIAIAGAADASFRLGGGMTSFAKLTRVSVAILSRYADPSPRRFKANGGKDPDCNFERVVPVDVAIEADRRARSPIIIGEAARQLGFRLEPLAASLECTKPLTEAEILTVMDEATDLWREARAAFADGRIDELDRKKLRKELREIIRAAERVLAKLEDE